MYGLFKEDFLFQFVEWWKNCDWKWILSRKILL